jgi:hypothetical protein
MSKKNSDLIIGFATMIGEVYTGHTKEQVGVMIFSALDVFDRGGSGSQRSIGGLGPNPVGMEVYRDVDGGRAFRFRAVPPVNFR